MVKNFKRSIKHRKTHTVDLPKLLRYENHLVFVYGTFRQTSARSSILTGSDYLGTGWTVSTDWTMRNSNYSLINSFPVAINCRVNGMYNNDPRGRIFGEIYSVPTEKMSILDTIEANGLVYTRQKEKIELLEQIDYPIRDCWMYVGSADYWDKPKETVPFKQLHDVDGGDMFDFIDEPVLAWRESS